MLCNFLIIHCYDHNNHFLQLILLPKNLVKRVTKTSELRQPAVLRGIRLSDKANTSEDKKASRTSRRHAKLPTTTSNRRSLNCGSLYHLFGDLYIAVGCFDFNVSDLTSRQIYLSDLGCQKSINLGYMYDLANPRLDGTRNY